MSANKKYKNAIIHFSFGRKLLKVKALISEKN